MSEEKINFFTEEELKALAELSKDAVRWTLSEKDFKEAKDNVEKENEPQQWLKAVAILIEGFHDSNSNSPVRYSPINGTQVKMGGVILTS